MIGLKAFLVSYLSSIVYFAFINPSPLRWFPLVFVVAVVIRITQRGMFPLYVAAASGFFMDLHFGNIGPYLVLFVLMALLIRFLQDRVLVEHTFLSACALSLLVSIVYHAVQPLLILPWHAALLNFTRAESLLRIIMITIVSALGMISMYLVATIIAHLTHRYAKKSV